MVQAGFFALNFYKQMVCMFSGTSGQIAGLLRSVCSKKWLFFFPPLLKNAEICMSSFGLWVFFPGEPH